MPITSRASLKPLDAPSKMGRYNQFSEIIAEIRPETIVEIGTHTARRAAFLSWEALKYRSWVTYLGFDIFENCDKDFKALAMNDKGVAHIERARSKLERLKVDLRAADIESRRNPQRRFTFELVAGDTRDTLKNRSLVADLVFIDGDHRVATIQTDYAAVCNSRCVVFDDYLLAGEGGELPDLDMYGANRVVDSIPGARILPVKDRVKQGWWAALAVIGW